jgi:hypothetical protein
MTTPFKKKKTPMGVKKPKGQYVTISGKKVFTQDPKTIFREESLKTMGKAVDKTAKFFKDLFK